jgi:hypothetical protein
MDNIEIVFDRIIMEYYNLKTSYKQKLLEDYNIITGTEYARYIMNELIIRKG